MCTEEVYRIVGRVCEEDTCGVVCRGCEGEGVMRLPAVGPLVPRSWEREQK